MSLFGGFDMEDDPFFGSHMRTVRQMNNMMNSLFADPFGMMGGFGSFDSPFHPRPMHHPGNAMMPIMPNFNRLLSSSLDTLEPRSFSNSSTTIVSMSSGPDGRPQVYKATSSTRCGPGGVKETQRTVSDSVSGTKKMAIGHHIGERAHIVEKEQNLHTGDREEREELINLDDDEKDDFNKEWETKTRSVRPNHQHLSITGANRNRHSYGGHTSALPAIMSGPSRRSRERQSNAHSTRRNTRPSLLNIDNSSSVMTKPYSPVAAGQQQSVRKSKNIKTVNGSPPPNNML